MPSRRTLAPGRPGRWTRSPPLLAALLLGGCGPWSEAHRVPGPRLTVAAAPDDGQALPLGAPTALTWALANDGALAGAWRVELADPGAAAEVGLLGPEQIELPAGAEADLVLQVELLSDAELELQLTLRAEDPAAAGLELRIVLQPNPDADEDLHEHALAGGDDCDDADPAVHPGAEEVWYDGVDQDCDGDDLDADADGHAGGGGPDCDDADPAVHPGAEEVWYDGVDQDCDGDDLDADGDGYAGGGGPDCDDTDAAVHPGLPDPTDGVDQDCDGIADDDDLRVGLLAITELWLDAGVGGPRVELAHAGGLDRGLLGWSLATDAGRGDLVAFDGGPLQIAADGALVLCPLPDPGCDGTVDPWPAINESADGLRLRAGGSTIDTVRWTATWPWAPGEALGLDGGVPADARAAENDDPARWCPTGDGTPAAPNPSCG